MCSVIVDPVHILLGLVIFLAFVVSMLYIASVVDKYGERKESKYFEEQKMRREKKCGMQ